MKLLADTSALLALILRNDRHHPAATAFARANTTTRYVVTDLILVETVTRLRARSDAGRAVNAVRSILASRRYQAIFVDPTLFAAGVDRMETFDDKQLSLVDCVSFALMDAFALDGAFTFDRDFRDCGYGVFPGGT